MSSQSLTNREGVGLFFSQPSSLSSMLTCQCGVSRLQKKGGVSNLLQHFERKRPLELKSARERKNTSGQRDLSKRHINSKIISIHGWISYLLQCLRPFWMVQNEDVCFHIWYDKSSLNNFKLYLSKLSTVFKANISRMLPKNFALIFDGHTTTKAHYVAMFATFTKKDGLGYGSEFLALSPLEDGTSQSADENMNFL